MTADRSRASIAWTRPSRNDCSSRAAWYSAFSLRSPCSLAVRIRAMTSRPLDRRSARRARPAAAPRPRRSAPSARRRRRRGRSRSVGRRPRPRPRGVGRRPSRTRRRGGRVPPRALGRRAARRAPSASPSGTLDDAGRRAPAAPTGSAMQRAGQPGRLALAGRRSQVGQRQDDVAVGERRPLGLRDAVGERREQRVLVLLGRVGRGPPDPGAVERAERREPVAAASTAAGRRAPCRAIAATRRAIERSLAPT